MKILIVGSRNFCDYKLFKDILNNIIHNNDNIEIISGGAIGADKFAEQYAFENKLPIKIFYPDWNKYGKSAGYRRNAEMHKYISEFDNRLCIAFWDGKSKGTQHNFNLAKQYKNPIKVIQYKNEEVNN